MEEKFKLLADLTRQPVYIGRPPLFIFNEPGSRLDPAVISASAQLRLAEAAERIATALESQSQLLVHNLTLPDAFSAEQWQDGTNHIHTRKLGDERLVRVDLLATSPEMAQRLQAILTEVFEGTMAAFEGQEGGQAS